MMRKVSIAVLKARLSEYIRAVETGEEVIVTDRGRPVARLGPVDTKAQADARMAELIRTGKVRPALGPIPPEFWTLERPKDPEGRSLQFLLEERAEGR